jgi:hypothetical protein
MTVDIQKSILSSLYTTLTADTTLKAAMGGTVRLYPVWAEVDAEFPYLVNKLDLRGTEFFPNQTGTYLVDIWSDSTNAEETLAIRKRIVELLDELQFDTTEAVNGKIWKQTDGFIPETTPGIWHYTIQFNIRFYRKSETGVIIGR